VEALKRLVLSAFVLVVVMCLVESQFGSRARRMILVCLTVVISLFLMARLTSVLYSEGVGVNRMVVDLSAFSWRSFCIVQL